MFATTRGLESNSQPAPSESNKEALNFAIGRARARNTHTADLIDLSVQVKHFLHQTQGTSLENTLCAIEIGANDVRDALSPPTGVDPSIIVTEALNEIESTITKLYEVGVRKFLVWNIPDIGKTPTLRFLENIHPGVSSAAGRIAKTFNTGLKVHIKALSKLHEIAILELNVHKIFNQMVLHPEEYGLSVVDTAYIKQNEPTSCLQDPATYLFWDGIHPTEVFHEAVAREADLLVSQ